MEDANEKMISPLGVAKYLDDKLKAATAKHCDTCSCPTRDMRVLADIDQTYTAGVQTTLQSVNFELCSDCTANWNAQAVTKHSLTKSSDSIAVHSGPSEKLHAKKDELVVNPILGHSSRPKPTQSQSINSRSLSSLSAKSANAPSNDGSKIFQSFNRSLIKSIKVRARCRRSPSNLSHDTPRLQAEKPNINGPRLCALRIPNESKSILLDSIESESDPVIYTRRSRFLDEEFDEIRDAMVSSDSGGKEPNLTLNISMLMSEGPKTHGLATPNKLQSDKDDRNNISSDTVAIGADLLLCKVPDDYQSAKQDESELLRQQQLSRVAEWVQNNTSIRQSNDDYGRTSDAFSPSLSEYKIDDSSNNDEVSDFSVDRDLQSFSSINQINTINNNIQINNRSTDSAHSDAGTNDCLQNGVDANNIENNNSNKQVDLAQMEYNVKQFLLKQNEWSSNGPAYSDLT